MINSAVIFGGSARRLALVSLLALVGAVGCCSSKNPSFFKKFDRRFGSVEADSDIQALTHFSYAQQLALNGDNRGAIRELKQALGSDPDSAYLRKVLAYLLYQEGELDQALDWIRESINADPDRPDAHQIMGMILYEMERFSEAEQAFLKALELEPDNSEHAINSVEAMLRQNRPDKALSVLGRYLSDHPEDVDALYYMAAVFHGTGNFDEAAVHYRRVLARAPAHYPALNGLFRMESSRSNQKRAIELGRAILAYYPDDVNTRLALVELLVGQGMVDESLEILDQGKRSGVLVTDWWLQKGYLLLREDRAAEAREEFEAVLSLDPESVEPVLALGLAEAVLGNPVEAMSYFESVPRESELYPEARRQLALLALKQGEPGRAVAIMDKLYQSNSDNPVLFFSYVAVLRDAEDYGRAEQLISKAIEDNPQDVELRYELGINYYLQGNMEASMDIMQGLLDKNPENPQILNFIGYSWAEQGVNLDQAEAMIRKALELEPDAGYIMDSLGWVYFQRGDYKKAMEWIDKAIESMGDDPEILEHKADIYRAQRKITKARQTYEQALEKTSSERIKKRIKKKLKEMG
jgi:tetratricopeptide (TPR) repeat protein